VRGRFKTETTGRVPEKKNDAEHRKPRRKGWLGVSINNRIEAATKRKNWEAAKSKRKDRGLLHEGKKQAGGVKHTFDRGSVLLE